MRKKLVVLDLPLMGLNKKKQVGDPPALLLF